MGVEPTQRRQEANKSPEPPAPPVFEPPPSLPQPTSQRLSTEAITTRDPLPDANQADVFMRAKARRADRWSQSIGVPNVSMAGTAIEPLPDEIAHPHLVLGSLEEPQER
jgi:hypothetical protein